jgi:16S rRNA (guanine(527)-N(7))-methyltransferase RsmG
VSYLEVLESDLRKFDIELPAAKKQLLSRYCDELVHWNKRINLTGLNGVEMVRRLVVEPVWIGDQLKPQGTLADIGSGNGSPAVPMHIVCSFSKVHLIEARMRRAAFLRHLTTTMPLPRVVIHRARLEDVTSEVAPVDWITLQGVGLTGELLDPIEQIAAATTNIVWISSAQAKLPLSPVRILRVPHTGREVFVFRVG